MKFSSDCEFRQVVSGGHGCTHPRVHAIGPLNIVNEKICRGCRSRFVPADAVELPSDAYAKAAAEHPAEATLDVHPVCIHQGKRLRMADCRLCGGVQRQEPIHHCELHGCECMFRKYKTTTPAERICQSCPDFTHR